ncbi:MAG TPA: AraC family transcriptional regulator [Bryobacteraceae bacterium]|jgi:transcriptional regulator GlxA family with amidase domain
MTLPGPPSVPVRAESIGAYFRAGAVIPGVPAMELEDRVVALESVWGAKGSQLVEELCSLQSDTARLDRLESALVQRMAASHQVQNTSLDVPKMAGWIIRNGGALSVERLAEVAGLSRRHFTRVFRENIGVSPKTYCRLARFRSALAYIPHGNHFGWAQVALECGYADQSHMIAEVRRFSGFSPEALARGRWFHPFMEIALRSGL